MSGRTIVRLLAALGSTALALGAGVYFLNPLRTASHDPRLRIGGYAPFRTPSRAMQPTLRLHGVFIVSAWAYRSSDPKPGDVVVFQYPADRSVLIVKRVVAAGGSTVEIVDGVTLVDGKAVDEPYVEPRNRVRDVSRRMPLLRVPANTFFVMGDNRDDSDDSRFWGPVPSSHIVGKVESVSTPANR